MTAPDDVAAVMAGDDSLVPATPPGALATLQLLQAIPEERLWLEGHQSPHTRAAYRTAVAGFMAFLGITTTDELRQVDRAAVLAWKRQLEETKAKPATIRCKLAALSSLFSHLVPSGRRAVHWRWSLRFT